MTTFNVVRFRVKPGQEEAFLDAHRTSFLDVDGMIRGSLVKTGDRSYMVVGEWGSRESMIAARPQMIANLDRFRATLEDLGNGLGVTDPVSGEVVLDLKR